MPSSALYAPAGLLSGMEEVLAELEAPQRQYHSAPAPRGPRGVPQSALAALGQGSVQRAPSPAQAAEPPHFPPAPAALPASAAPVGGGSWGAGGGRGASVPPVYSLPPRTQPQVPTGRGRGRGAPRAPSTRYTVSPDDPAPLLTGPTPPPGAHSGWRRVRPSEDPSRDRSPLKGAPGESAGEGEVWHRVGPADGYWPPEWHTGGTDIVQVLGGEDPSQPPLEFSTTFPGHPHYRMYGGEPLAGYAPGGAPKIQQVAAEIVRRRAEGTWPQAREPWEAGASRAVRAGTSAEQRQRFETLVEGLTLSSAGTQGPTGDPTRDFVLEAAFLPVKVGVSIAPGPSEDTGGNTYSYSGEEEEAEELEEYEEEEEEEEVEETVEDVKHPAKDEDEYEQQLRVFRRQMAEFRRVNPEAYPDHLRKALDSGLPRKYHKHFMRELEEIEANGGVVPPPETDSEKARRRQEKKERKEKKVRAAAGAAEDEDEDEEEHNKTRPAAPRTESVDKKPRTASVDKKPEGKKPGGKEGKPEKPEGKKGKDKKGAKEKEAKAKPKPKGKKPPDAEPEVIDTEGSSTDAGGK